MVSQGSFIDMVNEVLSRQSSDIVSPDLYVYLMELRLLQLSEDPSFVVHDVELMETLVEKCVSDLKQNSVSMKTLNLQFLWRKKYQSRDVIKKIHHERVFKNVFLLMSEITEESVIKTLDKDHLFKKIAVFIIMFAGLGSPTQQSIIKETQAALHSIFKTTEVESFLSLPKTTKEQQLIEFARLITGILLFNKDCKKGGEGMDDLPLILTQGVQATRERLYCFKDQLDQKIEQLLKILLHNYEVKASEPKMSVPQDCQREKLEEFKTLLIYYRQIEHCLNDIMKDLEKSFVLIQQLVERLQGTLLQVHNVVRYRVAVSTAQVFPLFLQLSNVWVEMQEEVDILSEINNNFVDLTLNAKAQFSVPIPWEMDLTNNADPSSESVEIQYSSEFYPGVKVCSVSSIPSHDRLQYKGFCAWTLAHAEGLLITGNITIGVMHFSSRYYTFSSVDSAHKWALNPNHYITTVLSVARVKPELITFLNLENDFLKKLIEEENQKPTVSDVEIQTDLHPLKSYVNKDYTFSEWELKKRAMKLATITRCLTKSQQTIKKSFFRTEMVVQVTPCKNVSTQTGKEGFCSHPGAPRSAWILTRRNQEETSDVSHV